MSDWTKEEKQKLQELYPTNTAKEISKELQRSTDAIYTMASKLDIEKQSSRKNTKLTCKTCNSEYQYKDNWRHTKLCRACYDRQRRIQRKIKVVEEIFDGECERCGYNECYRSLTFHHNSTAGKEFGLSNILRRSWEKVVEEAEKCTLLCANCHNKHHCSNC